MACKGDRVQGSNPSTKRSRLCALSSSSESEDEGETTALGQSATLTDLSVFVCSICSEPLLSTVYQCENGHTACGTCRVVSNKCPKCRSSIGWFRNRSLEKVVGSVKVSCRNMLYGCNNTFKLEEKHSHDKVCQYKPCTCPYENCNYVAMPKSLFRHFQSHCPSRFDFNVWKSIILDDVRTRVFLQDSKQRALFVLKLMIRSRGRYLSVACVGPDSMQGAFSYGLKTEIDGETCVRIKAGVVCLRKWKAESVLGKCIALPRDMVDEWGKLKVNVIIKRNRKRG